MDSVAPIDYTNHIDQNFVMEVLGLGSYVVFPASREQLRSPCELACCSEVRNRILHSVWQSTAWPYHTAGKENSTAFFLGFPIPFRKVLGNKGFSIITSIGKIINKRLYLEPLRKDLPGMRRPACTSFFGGWSPCNLDLLNDMRFKAPEDLPT